MNIEVMLHRYPISRCDPTDNQNNLQRSSMMNLSLQIHVPLFIMALATMLSVTITTFTPHQLLDHRLATNMIDKTSL